MVLWLTATLFILGTSGPFYGYTPTQTSLYWWKKNYQMLIANVWIFPQLHPIIGHNWMLSSLRLNFRTGRWDVDKLYINVHIHKVSRICIQSLQDLYIEPMVRIGSRRRVVSCLRAWWSYTIFILSQERSLLWCRWFVEILMRLRALLHWYK